MNLIFVIKIPMNFALIGCGKISQKYTALLTQGHIHGAALTAVCDADSKRASECGKKYSIPHYSDYHQMLAKEGNRIDVVAVMTPSGHHAQCVKEIAGYAKHIVVEKPMALTLADADSMIKACDLAGVKLFVVKQNRCNRPVKKLREAVEGGRFGKMVMGTVRVRWCRRQPYYDGVPWRGTWRHDGGVFANQAIHHIDLLQWMMGPVESLYAKSATRLVDIEAEDTGVAVVKFSSGALGVIEATTATRPADIEGSLSVLGERGAVEIGGFAANEMKLWNFEGESAEEKREIIDRFGKNPEGIYAFSHRQYLNGVVKNIAQGQRGSLVNGLAGRKSLELITALYESIETGREVAINFSPQRCRLGLM